MRVSRARSAYLVLRLAASTGRAIDLASGITCIIGVKLDIDRGKFGGLAWPPHRRIAAEFLKLLLTGAADTCSGVQIGPGATPLTRMPFDARCLARDRT